MRVDNSDKVPGSSDRTHTREVLGSEFKRCQRAPPMTYSLRGSFIRQKQSTGQHLPRQPRQLRSVNMTRSRSCMPKIHPRQKPLEVLTHAVQDR
jgi:hypothetical protein